MKKLIFIMMLACLHLPAVSLAGNLKFLKGAIVTEFTDKDWELFSNTMQKALNQGQVISWHNQESGNGGNFTPLETSSYQGMDCRMLEITNKTKTQQASSKFVLCKTKDGIWKFKP